VFIVLGWSSVIIQGVRKSEWEVPIALYTLSGAVFLGLISLQFLYLSPTDRFFAQADAIVKCLLFTSLIFVVSSIVLLIWSAGYRKGTLLAGSISMLVIDVVGFLWFVF
jgi:hypothetical protein